MPPRSEDRRPVGAADDEERVAWSWSSLEGTPPRSLDSSPVDAGREPGEQMPGASDLSWAATHEPGAASGTGDPGSAGAAGHAGTGRGRPGPASSPLARWRQGRIDPGRRGVAALALVAVLAALLAGFIVLRARPRAVLPPAVVATGVPVPGSSAAVPAPAGEVVVSVGGKVPRPGLLRLAAGSRVDDAVRAAGGPLPGADLADLNLARRLVDGEQLLVGVSQPAGATAPGPSTGVGNPLVDLNSATLAELDSLPGIGPVLAQKMLDWRTEHGRFGSVDQLREVSGIGESKYAEIKARVRV